MVAPSVNAQVHQHMFCLRFSLRAGLAWPFVGGPSAPPAPNPAPPRRSGRRASAYKGKSTLFKRLKTTGGDFKAGSASDLALSRSSTLKPGRFPRAIRAWVGARLRC